MTTAPWQIARQTAPKTPASEEYLPNNPLLVALDSMYLQCHVHLLPRDGASGLQNLAASFSSQSPPAGRQPATANLPRLAETALPHKMNVVFTNTNLA